MTSSKPRGLFCRFFCDVFGDDGEPLGTSQHDESKSSTAPRAFCYVQLEGTTTRGNLNSTATLEQVFSEQHAVTSRGKYLDKTEAIFMIHDDLFGQNIFSVTDSLERKTLNSPASATRSCKLLIGVSLTGMCFDLYTAPVLLCLASHFFFKYQSCFLPTQN